MKCSLIFNPSVASTLKRGFVLANWDGWSGEGRGLRDKQRLHRPLEIKVYLWQGFNFAFIQAPRPFYSESLFLPPPLAVKGTYMFSFPSQVKAEKD